MKNSADLGGCYPPRPSASVDNTLLDLQNSSYPTQPHSIIIIAKYRIAFKILFLYCYCSMMQEEMFYEFVKLISIQGQGVHHLSLLRFLQHEAKLTLPLMGYQSRGYQSRGQDGTILPARDNPCFLHQQRVAIHILPAAELCFLYPEATWLLKRLFIQDMTT